MADSVDDDGAMQRFEASLRGSNVVGNVLGSVLVTSTPAAVDPTSTHQPKSH